MGKCSICGGASMKFLPPFPLAKPYSHKKERNFVKSVYDLAKDCQDNFFQNRLIPISCTGQNSSFQLENELVFSKFKVSLKPINRTFSNFVKTCVLPCSLKVDHIKIFSESF